MARRLPEFSHPSQGAVYMRTNGFRILPLRPFLKTPAVKDWQQWSRTATAETVSTFSADANWGVHPGLSGHFVLDVDSGNGKKGAETLAALEAKYGKLPETFEVKTPSGGRHLYFKGIVDNTVGRIGKNLDTRCQDGYVVAPGSVLISGDNELRYEIVRDGEAVAAPDWLIAAAQPKAAAVLERTEIDEPDQPQHVEAAKAYLLRSEPCIEGEGGDAQMFKVLCGIRDLGITMETARELVLEHFNDRCSPPWEEEELEVKLNNAYKYAQNSLGAKTAEAAYNEAKKDFSAVPLPPTSRGNPVDPQPITSLPLMSAASINGKNIPKRDWIINGFLLGSFLSITGAPGGTGKSNVEILKMLSVVTGKPLLGDRYPVERKGAAILYNCEDPLDEMVRRVEAFRLLLRLTKAEIAELYLISGRDHSVNVASVNRAGEVAINEKAVATLVETVKSVNAVVLSVDPLVRTHWLNENDNMAMDKVTQAFQRVSSATGCAVSVVHHTNKGALKADNSDSSSQAGFRGAGSLVASARIGHLLTTMGDVDAKRMGVPLEKRRFYFKIESAKANLSAPAEYADWFITKGQEIPNGETIGVCERVDLVTQVSIAEIDREQEERENFFLFLRTNIPEGKDKTLTELKDLALLGGCDFANPHATRFLETTRKLIGVSEEFKLCAPAKEKGKWLVKRHGMLD